MDYGTQLVSLCIGVVVIVEFFQYRRLRLLSSRMFEIFLFLAAMSMILEIACRFAVTNSEYFSILTSRILNQLYFGSLSLLVFYNFLYVDMRSRVHKSYSIKQFTWRLAPLVFAIVSILLGDVYYHVGNDGVYFYGSMVSAVYWICGIYVLFTAVAIANVVKRKIFVIGLDLIFCIIIWCSIAVYEYLVPTASFISLAVALMVLYIYISFENSKENVDKDIRSILSTHSFMMTAEELFGEKKRFWVINFSLQNIESIKSTYSQSACLDCIAQSIRSIPDLKRRNVFRTTDYSFGFILFSEDEVKDWYARYKVSDKALNLEDTSISPSFFVYSIECPKIAKDAESLQSLISFCKTQFEAQSDHSMVIIDEETAQKRDYILAVERLVQKAIDEDGFYVVYQPIINAKTGKCESAEALVRLKDTKSFGFISPEIFIPVAERKGLISRLGDQVLYKVCSFIRESHLTDRGIKYIEVNLSGIQIADPGIPYRIQQCVKSFGLDPSVINLEITETATIKSGKIALDNMNKLKQFGYKFSMDDFGTGYSNFHQIASTQYDLIKIDKSLIWPAFEPDNQQSRTILFACIKMMHALGLGIVAEGVETKEQAEALTARGVEFLQGYYYSKPITEDNFINFIRTHNRKVEDAYLQKHDQTYVEQQELPTVNG